MSRSLYVMIYSGRFACPYKFWGVGMTREKNPIILVHGFLGFDAETIINFPYWGGTIDLVESLRKDGYRVFSAQVGPVSSNWDRACELYAFLFGGRVDYGAAHAERHGHARYGRTYPGIFSKKNKSEPGPESGPEYEPRSPTQASNQTEPEEEAPAFHLVGHSMGGQTARLLAELLAKGDPDEMEHDQPDRSPLFKGGHRCVKSVTTLSTPHDGTTLGYRFRDMGVMGKLFTRLLVMASLRQEDPFLDLMLDHWKPAADAAGEDLEDFTMRVINENAWQRAEDFCFRDLVPEGAMELNRRAPAREDVYYFSWSNSCTRSAKLGEHHVPRLNMSIPLHPNARYMGSLMELPDFCGSDPVKWWENDGMVNTCSMRGPTIDSGDRITDFDISRLNGGGPKKGVWNHMGVLSPLDHWKMHMVPPLALDAPPGYDSLLDFYRRWCGFLYSLP